MTTAEEPAQPATETPPAPPTGQRACLYWLVWLGFALVGLSGWLRMAHALASWYWLSFAEIWPGPRYLALTGAAWGLVGLAAAGWILLRRPWSALVGLSAALFFALTFWADRLLFSRAPGSLSNAPFALLLTLLCLGAVLLALPPLDDLRRISIRRIANRRIASRRPGAMREP